MLERTIRKEKIMEINKIPSYQNISVNNGPEANSSISLKDKVLEKLKLSPYYAQKGLAELDAVAKLIAYRVDQLESGDGKKLGLPEEAYLGWNIDVVGLSINNDGSVSINWKKTEKPGESYLVYTGKPTIPLPKPSTNIITFSPNDLKVNYITE